MSGSGEMGESMNGDRRTRLEQRAEAVRARLERRLDALDERREHLVALAKKISRPPASVVLLGTATAVGVLFVAHQLRRRRPSRGQRLGAMLLGVAPQRPDSFMMKAFKRAALSLVATVVQRVGTRGLDRLLPETSEPPRPRAL